MKNLIVGVVLFENELSAVLTKLDVNQKQGLESACQQFKGYDFGQTMDGWNRISKNIMDYNSVLTKFGVQSYRKEKSETKKEDENIEKEDLADYQAVQKCLKTVHSCDLEGENVKNLKPTALHDICKLQPLEKWPEEFASYSEITKRAFSAIYVGTQSGIFKVFPAYNMPVDYEPTVRPWYRQAAVSEQLEFVIYKDILWNTFIISVSKAVRHGSELAMVFAIDIQIEFFQDLIDKDLECAAESTACMLINKQGRFITHPDIRNRQNFMQYNVLYFQGKFPISHHANGSVLIK